jgi:formylglycine-generating enzyme required for sulfatase activity
VQWANMPPSEATWEQVDEFHAAHPSFQLEDELFSEGGEMLWWVAPTRGRGDQWLSAAKPQRPNERCAVTTPCKKRALARQASMRSTRIDFLSVC